MITMKTNLTPFPEHTGPFTDDLIPPGFDRRGGKNAQLNSPVRAIRATDAGTAAPAAPKKTPPKLGAKSEAAPKAAKSAAVAKAPKVAKPAKAKGYNVAAGPKSGVTAARAGSSQALTLDLLSRVKGATLADIVAMERKRGSKALDASIKTFLPTLVKMRGYGIRTTFDKSGEIATYFLVLPTGMTEMVAHKTAEAKAVPAAKKGAAKK